MNRFENKRKGTLKLLNGTAHHNVKVGLAVLRIAIPEVLDKHSHCFGVCIRLELVTALFEYQPQLAVVCDDTIVYHSKLTPWVTFVGMAVEW